MGHSTDNSNLRASRFVTVLMVLAVLAWLFLTTAWGQGQSDPQYAAKVPASIQPAPQGLTSLSANARGQGTLTIGREAMKIHSVVVQLKEDGTGEIMLVTDFTLFVNCTWTVPADLTKGIDLKVTGGTTAGGATGSGKLLLKPDGKSIARLSMDGSNNTSKRKIKVNFVAE